MKQVALVAFCLLLTACQSTGPLNENSPFHILPAGSRLLLKQEITIPARSAGVMLQGGRVVSDKDVNQYHPHCRLEVNDVRDTTQSVAADEFVVRRARQEDHQVMGSGFMKAGLHNMRKASATPTYHVFRTILDLESPRQPQVRWLTCQQWSEPAIGVHVTIREMRQTLGEIIQLQLPAETSGLPK
jgi:hypothetical protein